MDRVIFRADANRNIGMGHVMRCLSIADEFSIIGCQVEFIIADDSVLELIRSRGYKACILDSDYKNMEDELSLWPEDNHPNLIIVDSYYVTEAYLSMLQDKTRRTGGKLIYLDDVYAFPYPVDIIINYNAYAAADIYEKLYTGTSIEKPQMILKPTYAPLRSMFRNVPNKLQNENIQNILISTGGSDKLHLALTLVKSILASKAGEAGGKVRTDYTYHFLLGAMNTDKEFIRELAEKNENIILHENVVDIKSLIVSSDLAISAAGSTLYEVAACGVPLITYSLADNQIPSAEAFEQLGLAVNVGDLRDPTTIDDNAVMSGDLDETADAKILAAIEELSRNYERRVAIGKRMQEMIDGLGANRMVEKILSVT